MEEHSRRDVLKGIGVAGTVAAVGSTPTLAQDSCVECSVTQSAVSNITDPIFYNAGKTFKWISPWHSLGGEEAANDEYEYQQRLAIYNQAYNWMQFTERQLTGVQNQGDLYSRSAMEDGLVELFHQAEADAASADAITAAKDVIRGEWESIFRQYAQHFEQTAIAAEKWYNPLSQIDSDLSGSTTVSYTMVAYCPFTGDIFDIGSDYSEGPETAWNYRIGNGIDEVTDLSTFHYNDYDYPAVFLTLPLKFSDYSAAYDEVSDPPSTGGTAAGFANDLWTHTEQSDWSAEAWDPYEDTESWTKPTGSCQGNDIYSALRISPPAPVDFDVNEEDVQDVSDHPRAFILNIPLWEQTMSRLLTLMQESLDGLETWANGNYTDVKNNPGEWSIDDMVGPSALSDAAQQAKNPAEAALGLHGKGVPTNLENDVLVEFQNTTDSDGNLLRAPGYLAMLNPPSDGLPVGEVIDPGADEYSNATIYFAFWNSDLVALPGIEDDGGNVSDDNVTNESDDLDGDQSDDYGTYSVINESFKIVRTASGSGSVQFEARDVSDPDYDWQTVVENLEAQNQALLDAQDQTITVLNDGGGGGGGPGADLPWVMIAAGLGGGALLAKGASDKSQPYR